MEDLNKIVLTDEQFKIFTRKHIGFGFFITGIENQVKNILKVTGDDRIKFVIDIDQAFKEYENFLPAEFPVTEVSFVRYGLVDYSGIVLLKYVPLIQFRSDYSTFINRPHELDQ